MDLYSNTSTDASGRFRFDRLAPGDYKLFVWEQVESGAWTDPEFLWAHEDLGTPIHIAEGSSVIADTAVIPSFPYPDRSVRTTSRRRIP